MLDVGRQIEKYEVLEHLGAGGFADVYRARHVHLGSEYALKILKPEFVEQEAIRHRFLDEARVQAQLDHPNIVRVTDIIAGEGVAGLVMELLQGTSLADEIDRGQRPDAARVRAVFLPVLDALEFAHGHDVVHRDIKPDNIFLASVRGGLRPKLLDFGIARIRGELREGEKRRSTIATSILGTPGYMSPEQLRSAASADARSDIFSLGVALLEYVTGSAPFDRESEVDTIVAVMAGDYAIPAALDAADPSLAAAIRTALQTAPEDRFADCAAFAAALDPGPEVVATPVRKALPASPERSVEAMAPDSPQVFLDLLVAGPSPKTFYLFDTRVEVSLDGQLLAQGSVRDGLSAETRVASHDFPRRLLITSRRAPARYVFPPDLGGGRLTLCVVEGEFGMSASLEDEYGSAPLKRRYGWRDLFVVHETCFWWLILLIESVLTVPEREDDDLG